jgi:hypothetical protein
MEFVLMEKYPRYEQVGSGAGDSSGDVSGDVSAGDGGSWAVTTPEIVDGC